MLRIQPDPSLQQQFAIEEIIIETNAGSQEPETWFLLNVRTKDTERATVIYNYLETLRCDYGVAFAVEIEHSNNVIVLTFDANIIKALMKSLSAEPVCLLPVSQKAYDDITRFLQKTLNEPSRAVPSAFFSPLADTRGSCSLPVPPASPRSPAILITNPSPPI